MLKKIFVIILLLSSQWVRSDSIDSLAKLLDPPKTDTTQLKLLNSLCKLYVDKNDAKLTLEYSIKLYNSAKASNSKLYLAQAFNKIGLAFKLQDSLDKSLIFQKTAFNLFKELKYKKAADACQIGILKIYRIKSDIQNFLKHLDYGSATVTEVENGVKWIYTGFFIFFSLYNLFLFFFSKDKAYLQMSLAVMCYEVFNEFCQAKNMFFLNYNYSAASLAFAIVFASPFLTSYFFNNYFIDILNTEKQKIWEVKLYKYFNKFLLIFVTLIFLFQIIIATFYENNPLLFKSFLFVLFKYDEFSLITLAISVAIILKIKIVNKVVHLNYVLVGIAFLVCGLVLSEMGSNGVGPDNFTDTINTMKTHSLGVALFLLFLSAEVSNKINIFRKEKESAQEKALEVLEEKVRERTLEVNHQKHLIEEKHKEITDSINYAERIQRSFIATKEILDENLVRNNSTPISSSNGPGYFVLFKPKDIVSGDFYWASKLSNGNFALATADSTGHGVPGAIMSLLNITSLEKAIETLTQPADILNSTRKTIIDRLKKDGSEQGGKDGMDCSLICFDFTNKKLIVAAANNPVWIVRTSTNPTPTGATINDIIEIKPDKMPVGKHDKDAVSFSQQEIDLQTGDMIYTLTDGFPDQFGGEKGKKFMSKNLRELLAANSYLPMNEQKLLLEKTFKNWVGDLEQVDDVTVIGVRV